MTATRKHLGRQGEALAIDFLKKNRFYLLVIPMDEETPKERLLRPQLMTEEFINFVLREGSNIAELCRRFNISRKTGYKFVSRYKQYGIDGLRDRSRRPSRSPAKTVSETEQLIIALRQRHQAWGGRKLKRRLEDLGYNELFESSRKRV